jgi:hypothetical protein
MSPVALPTVVQNDESDAHLESPLRASSPLGADGDTDSELERPL